jgi:glycosyltransferase involved in cell wall biosynthesis
LRSWLGHLSADGRGLAVFGFWLRHRESRGWLKILWAKANKILPVQSGGDIRSYNLARQLAARHQLTFFSYYDGPPDAAYEKTLREHFPGAVCIATGHRHDTALRRGLDYALRFPRQAPYAVSRFASRAVRLQLRRWHTDQAFDVAVCDFLDAAVNFPKELSIPTVLFQHNVESEIWRRHAETETNPVRRRIYHIEFSKMLAYEDAAARRFPHVVAVSEHDRELMSAWVDPLRISVVPTGVDLSQYGPDFSECEMKPLVVFVGAMDWEPNIDAVEFFCEQVWPSVLACRPQAKFRIVGRNPDRRVQRLAGKSIEVTGKVPAVINHLREAAVVVVPLRIGGGTRLKIYEAMAAGKAVVSTSVGAEGLDVHHGRDIILSDTPKTLTESILMLLTDGGLRRQYEHAAAELAARYDWPAVSNRFEEVLEKVAGHAPISPGRGCGRSGRKGSFEPANGLI